MTAALGAVIAARDTPVEVRACAERWRELTQQRDHRLVLLRQPVEHFGLAGGDRCHDSRNHLVEIHDLTSRFFARFGIRRFLGRTIFADDVFDADHETRLAGDRYAAVIGRYESPVDGLVDIDLHRDVAERDRVGGVGADGAVVQLDI